MSDKPLLTRAELRRRREQEQQALERNQKIVAKQAQKEFEQEEQRIARHYRKEAKKNKEIHKSRVEEKETSRALNSFLWKAIIVVGLLLILIFIFIFFI